MKIEFGVEKYRIPYTQYEVTDYVQFGKVKLLLGETIDYKFKLACFAEFLSMVFFIVISCGCAMVSCIYCCHIIETLNTIYLGNIESSKS